MKVRELIESLQEMSPEAKVEFEIPRDPLGHEQGGDRILVKGARETFYDDPANKWVILT